MTAKEVNSFFAEVLPISELCTLPEGEATEAYLLELEAAQAAAHIVAKNVMTELQGYTGKAWSYDRITVYPRRHDNKIDLSYMVIHRIRGTRCRKSTSIRIDCHPEWVGLMTNEGPFVSIDIDNVSPRGDVYRHICRLLLREFNHRSGLRRIQHASSAT